MEKIIKYNDGSVSYISYKETKKGTLEIVVHELADGWATMEKRYI